MGSKETGATRLSQSLKDRADQLGFLMLGIVPAVPSSRLDAYLGWLGAGQHGSMGYMARPDRVARREDLNLILPGARSLLIGALDYFTGWPAGENAWEPGRAQISNYAWGMDYHREVAQRLEELAGFLRDQAGGAASTRVYVDTGAILERSHAEQAGLGFVGKNTMLIHPRRGSFFFLGEIITTVELAYDEPAHMPDCGSCTRCLEVCPTHAFPAPYVLDARRCISYLTIEHKGTIAADLRPLMDNWVYGCDVCQQVCPWQRFAQSQQDSPFALRDDYDAMPVISDLLSLTEESFEARFAGSPIQRIGRDRLVRNACIVAGNSGVPELARALIPLLRDASPLVRGHAAWALGRLDAGRDELRAALETEADEEVQSELSVALKESFIKRFNPMFRTSE